MDTQPQGRQRQDTQPRDLVRAHYDASAAGDLEGMFAPFSTDIVWTEMAGSDYAGTYRGREEILAGVFARIGEDFSEFGFHPESLVAEAGDTGGAGTVVAIGSYRGTRRTGETAEARAVHVWQVADGRIIGFEQFADTALLRR